MLDKVIYISVDMTLIILGLLVASAFFINTSNTAEKKLLINFTLSGFMIVIGRAFFDFDLKTLMLFQLFLLSLINYFTISSNLKINALLFMNVPLAIIILFAPFDTLPYLKAESFFNTDFIYAFLGIIFFILLIRKATRLSYHDTVKNAAAILMMSTILLLVVPLEYALVINVFLLALLTWQVITGIMQQNAIIVHDLTNRLNRLENEFNDELRKAVNKHTFHLKEVQERMSHINKIDNLTKAYNKKAIFNMVDDLIMDRRTPEFAMIMFDIDHFKNLNDTLGHIKGDLCLRTLAKIAFESIRDTDYLGRYGGDEFMILLPKASFNTAMTIAERFRKKIQTETDPKFTVSIGVAHYPQDGNTLKGLLDIADKGLYVSKEKGRNSVSYHNPTLGKKI